MKQILINLQDKHKEQNLLPSQINLKSLTAENKLNPSVKLLPEYEEENVFRPKPTLFVSTMLTVSSINFFPHTLKKRKVVHTSRRYILYST